jgi:hypothetical protein
MGSFDFFLSNFRETSHLSNTTMCRALCQAPY